MSRARDAVRPGVSLRPVPDGEWGDYRTGDGRWLVQAKRRIHSVRDVSALVVEMAKRVVTAPRPLRACLALIDPRMSRDRLEEEWRTLKRLLHPRVADRLALLVLQEGRNWSIPVDRPLAAIGEALTHRVPAEVAPEHARHRAPSRKSFEILKVLVHHRLSRRGPVAISELIRISGCSYPTVSEALREWQRSGDVVRHSNRRVSLRTFPNQVWGQALVLLQTLRRTFAFGTGSDRPIDLQDLLRRLERTPPPGIALGGVVAARHWNADFDLHGLPRLDLCLHTSSGAVPADLLAAVDPALHRMDEPVGAARIVVHPVQRPESLFVMREDAKLPVVDPVETLLDLQELHLNEQANELARRLAGEERP